MGLAASFSYTAMAKSPEHLFCMYATQPVRLAHLALGEPLVGPMVCKNPEASATDPSAAFRFLRIQGRSQGPFPLSKVLQWSAFHPIKEVPTSGNPLP